MNVRNFIYTINTMVSKWNKKGKGQKNNKGNKRQHINKK